MTRSDDERVSDILDACHKLSEIAALGRSEYDKSWIIQSAVERQLEIIGEAATHLSDEFLGDDVELPIRQAKGSSQRHFTRVLQGEPRSCLERRDEQSSRIDSRRNQPWRRELRSVIFAYGR